ncbi:MAG: 5'/3'-nucleotidase SurE [Deltaproteobacteria bacterium]|nr:5'/3'-nucleotidase SurE [Candidatus Anaeroferrophillus wilburensis]MBN2889497.1 5'/3'-nucleotidase SurE [Deltaproteobacteria bacterium]
MVKTGRKRRILVANDDGISAFGIKVLADTLADVGTVTVVAPDREQSACSHSLTLRNPLRVEQVAAGWYAVDGTPTDCINLAINAIMKDTPPDLVVSGINKGGNLGDDITYSGTVAAAFEGTLLGIPSLAVSLVVGREHHFETAGRVALEVAERIFHHGMPADTLFNVNVPDRRWEDLAGYRVTKQGKRIYSDAVMENVDPRGQKYYWIGGDVLGGQDIENSDFQVIQQGCVSLTPLHLDLTNYRVIEALKRWEWSR